MQIRVACHRVTALGLSAFLNESKLFLPVFVDVQGNIVITINPRNRADAIKLIDWLMAQ
jgi:hypothetical protein